MKIPIFAKVPGGFIVNLKIREQKFCKIVQLFIVSVSLARVSFEGTRENILHIFRVINTSQCCLGFFQ
jgi:hypothetical protein